MKITIPIEASINIKDYKSKRKIKKVSKEIKTWMVNFLKNVYIPISDNTDMVVVKKIKVGKIL